MDWPFLEHDNKFESFPSVTITSGSNNVKTGYFQITAATGFKYHGFWICLSGYLNTAFDIAIGAAGQEIIIAPNLCILCGNNGSDSFFVPIEIPAGTRIAARAQQASASFNVSISLIGVGGDLRQSLQNCDTYGVNLSTTRGTQIDPGATANQKGSWVEISSSTSRVTRALLLSLGNNQSTSWLGWRVDIGIGGAGSEIVLIPDFNLQSNGGFSINVPSHYGPIYVNIAAGTRLAVRAQCTVNTTPARYFDIVLHCFY